MSSLYIFVVDRDIVAAIKPQGLLFAILLSKGSMVYIAQSISLMLPTWRLLNFHYIDFV